MSSNGKMIEHVLESARYVAAGALLGAALGGVLTSSFGGLDALLQGHHEWWGAGMGGAITFALKWFHVA